MDRAEQQRINKKTVAAIEKDTFQPEVVNQSPSSSDALKALVEQFEEEWQVRSRCRDKNALADEPVNFFADEGSVEERRARAFCGQCAVKVECLDTALKAVDDPDYKIVGVWAGTSATERVQIVKLGLSAIDYFTGLQNGTVIRAQGGISRL